MDELNDRFDQFTQEFTQLESSLPEFDTRFMSFLRNREQRHMPTIVSFTEFVVTDAVRSQDIVIPALSQPATSIHIGLSFMFPTTPKDGLRQIFWLVDWDEGRQKGVNRQLYGSALIARMATFRAQSGRDVGQDEKLKLNKPFTPQPGQTYDLMFDLHLNDGRIHVILSNPDDNNLVFSLKGTAPGTLGPATGPFLFQLGYPTDHGVELQSPIGTVYSNGSIEFRHA